MKIVHLIQRYPPAVGGSEKWCEEVCGYLSKKGHDVKVLTLDIVSEEEFWRDPPDHERTMALGPLSFDSGVAVRRYHRSLPVHSVYHLFFKRFLDQLLNVYFYGPHSLEMYTKMWREIKKADLVFLHTIPYPHNYFGMFWAKVFNRKTVIVPHFHPGHPFHERRTHYWLLKQCDAVITVSEFEKRYLQHHEISAERLFVTGNAIHPDEYLPEDLDGVRSRMHTQYGLQPGEKVLTFIGRKIEDKGVAYLIESIRDLLGEMRLKLFLVGPGSDWHREQYSRLHPDEQEHIIEMGTLSHQDKVNLLHISDLLILPSRYEAFGIVFLEAWICGVPVLGTTEGAMPGVIGDEGFVSRFGDVEDLKRKIREAFENEAKLKEMGARGRAKVLRDYTWEVIGQEVQTVVDKIFGKKKVVVCTNAYPPYFVGGAELIAHAYAKALKERGFEVVVFAGWRNDRRKRYSVWHDSYEGIPIRRVCLDRQDYSADYCNFYHRAIHDEFEELLESFAPDIVHFHNLTGLSVGLIQPAKRRRIKTVLTLHDYWGICPKNTLLKPDGSICEESTDCRNCQPFLHDEQWTNVPFQMRSDFIAHHLEMVDAIISPSSYLAERYEKSGITSSKLRIIPYGLDLTRFAHLPEKALSDKVRFSFVGYLGHHKGVHTLVKALALLPDKSRITVDFVGDGELKPWLKKKVKEMGLNGIVRFRGKIDHRRVKEVYGETDVLVLPSVWPDNHPVCIIEAMASGIPVIASRMGGIPELVDDGLTGYLFEAGNAVDLAEKMALCVSEKDRLTVLGMNGLNKISRYELATQLQKVIGVYDEETAPEALNQGPSLIVCLGREVEQECLAALDSFRNGSDRSARVMHLDWLEEGQIEQAQLLWVVDQKVGTDEVMVGLRNKLPLLVPEKTQELRALCLRGNCGLYYQDAVEAKLCLEYLVSNVEVGKKLGSNGFKLFYSTNQR